MTRKEAFQSLLKEKRLHIGNNEFVYLEGGKIRIAVVIGYDEAHAGLSWQRLLALLQKGFKRGNGIA